MVLSAKAYGTGAQEPPYRSVLKAGNVRYVDPAESLRQLNTIYERELAAADYREAVSALLEMSETYGHQAAYKEAYDMLWKALSLTDAADMQDMKAQVYIEIGRYYSFFKRRDTALDYFQRALAINRRRVAAGEVGEGLLANNYYAFAATFRELNEPELASRYLDSSWLYFDPAAISIERAYLEFEQGYAEGQRGNYEQAEQIFRRVLPWMEANDPGYQTLVYCYLGDVLRERGLYRESERAYLTALEISEQTNSHRDFSPLVYRKLSEMYFSRGEFRRAYESLRQFDELDNRFFDSRSKSNRPLLEIQDAFRQEKEEQAAKVQRERLATLEREKEVEVLKLTVLGTVALLVMLSGLLYLKYIRTKHRSEKALIRQEREAELRRANEIVTLKNKELAATTLKLIAKDEFIVDIQNRLTSKRGAMDAGEVNDIIRSIRSNTGNDLHWQEFEARFVAVNKDFYVKLKEAFPKLTQSDLRLCALIKLNFSSKDVAKLLGISVESVHTTRYRLRKKLGLERKVNLAEFIAGF